jgi:hypothetical protein
MGCLKVGDKKQTHQDILIVSQRLQFEGGGGDFSFFGM